MLLGIAAVYFGAANLGLSLAFATKQVTLVWPPAGIALASVLLLGYRAWPAIWLGAFAANATANEPVVTAAAIAMGNSLEALTGAWLLRRVPGFRAELDDVRGVLALVGLAAIASTTVSATIGTTTLVVTGVHPRAAFGDIWWTWWIGDAIGDLIVAPLVLTAAAWRRRLPWRRLAEALALVVSLVATTFLLFTGLVTWAFSAPAPRFGIFPFIIWGALRFGPPGAATVTFVAAAATTWATIRGSGLSPGENVEAGLVILQLYLGVVAVSGLLLAATTGQRRRAEEAARQSEDSLRTVLDSASTGTWSYSRLTGTVQWSPQVEAIHGLPPGSFEGNFEAYTRDIHGDDRERVLGAITEAMASGASHDIEYRIVRPDGTVRWIRGQGRAVHDGSGRVVGMTGLCTDITDRKRAAEALRESESRLKGIIESAMDAVVTVDQHERITLFNGAAERMFRCKRGEAIGTPLDRFIPPAARAAHHGHISRFGLTGVTSRAMGAQRPLRALRANGQEFPMEATISQTTVLGEKLYTVIIRDISERVRAEQERETLLARELEAHAELEAASRAKDEFLAVLGHELRNPLAAISNAASVLNHLSPPGDQTAQARQIITRQGHQLSRLVDELLDVARLESGKISLQYRVIDLREVAERCVATFTGSERSRGHRMEVAGDRALVEGDPVRLEQVVTNLVDNAVKYTPAGGRIAVGVEREGKEAVLRVLDTGIGIAPERVGQIFDPFVQADASVGRTQGGLGLGLALVARLVALHGGAVSASSPGPGRGSEFTIRLPLFEGLPARAERDRKDGGRPAPRRILIIEDNADARDALKILLTLWGHEVEVVDEGQRGLQRLLATRPDVALIDVGLPGLDGYAVARQFRAAPGASSTHLVALTGYGQSQDRQRASAAGFDVHLVKPVDERQLLSVLAAAPLSGGS